MGTILNGADWAAYPGAALLRGQKLGARS
jgi:hypothetical protein